ncbi:hypothetical protein J2X24_003874 [Asticcacaulis solisilvae]|nr:hypothetical protein [Asticcacaulis solisilvae]MDR6802343.1 hypothetical protein [Asticcacaulis sp. BE141]
MRIGEFRPHITDILTIIADTWQARTLDDFCAYAFD